MLFTLLFAGFGIASLVLAQSSVTDVRVTGNELIPSSAVVAASGLRPGSAATRPALEAAAQRLVDTGFFVAVNYRSEPGRKGYVVTLEVAEELRNLPVRLDIPGVEEKRLWGDLKSTHPLIDTRLPDNERASDYVRKALEALLGREIAMKTEADLSTGQSLAIFRPAFLPSVRALHFEGNRAIHADLMQATIAKLAVGYEYSEREFRRILELNLRPLYEEHGFLTVAFPAVRMAGSGNGPVDLTVVIEEGPAWTLGAVTLEGADIPVPEMLKAARFPEGKLANWKQIVESIESMQDVLRRDGYLGTAADPKRVFRREVTIVDLAIRVNKGSQFLFGALEVTGLSPADRQRAVQAWRLRPGEPLNGLYLRDYMLSVRQVLTGEVKSVQRELSRGDGSGVWNVRVAFR